MNSIFNTAGWLNTSISYGGSINIQTPHSSALNSDRKVALRLGLEMLKGLKVLQRRLAKEEGEITQTGVPYSMTRPESGLEVREAVTKAQDSRS